jgi:hypothetical protein
MSNDLFDHAMHERLKSEAPLAARMRPRTLDEYIGQEHIVGEGKLLRRAIEADKLFSSIILWKGFITRHLFLAADRESIPCDRLLLASDAAGGGHPR